MNSRRVFKLGGRVGHVTRHVWQWFKITRSRDVSADENAVTRQWMVISTSNLVGIINVRVGACGILSRSVGQTNRKQKYGGHSEYKMQKWTENVARLPKFCTLTENRGRRIERRCLNLHWKFINNRFCTCAAQMLLKMAVNATICSTFEVQYGKSTSTRAPSTHHEISRMRRNSCVF